MRNFFESNKKESNKKPSVSECTKTLTQAGLMMPDPERNEQELSPLQVVKMYFGNRIFGKRKSSSPSSSPENSVNTGSIKSEHSTSNVNNVEHSSISLSQKI